MSEEAIRKRALELEETGKGIAHFSHGEMPQTSVIAERTGASSTEVIRKEIEAQCRLCYQKVTLPSGTTTFRCEICGKTQPV